MAFDSISSALDSLPARKDKAQKAFSALDTQRSLISAYTTEWHELEQYFSEIEQAIQKKFEELAEKEKAFLIKTNEAKAALSKREESISDREKASLTRVQEQKDTAIAAIFEEKKKRQGGRQKKEPESPAAAAKVEESKSGPRAMDVDAPASKSGNAAPANGASNGPTSLVAAINQATIVASEVRARPQLKALCENMDGEGLRKFIVDRRKDIGAFRNELPSALQSAIDPCRLVLKAVDGYHLLQRESSHSKESGSSAVRRACILLLECLAQVLADPVLGVDYPVVPSNVKESARVLAKRWRSLLDVHKEIVNESSLDAQAFLQLLATFGIASEYKEDELCKLVTAIARRKQTPALCRSLGLTAKIPDLVDTLAKEGKQIEALAFAHAFEIMDRVEPVPMLKAYLKDARKVAQALAKNAPTAAAGQNDSTMKELSALKAVLKAVEEYKLVSQYPTENLHKRVDQLEKAKADRKRASTAFRAQAQAQAQAKKPRLSGVVGHAVGATGGVAASNIGAGGGVGYESSALPKPASTASALERGYYVPTDIGGQYGAAGLTSFGLANQIGYERRPEASYVSTYGAGNRSPVALSSSYVYSNTEGIGSSLYGSASAYSDPSGAYSGYQFGSSLHPSSSYPASYLR